MLISIAVFFFVVLPLFVVSPAAAVGVWLVDIFVFVWGYAGWKNDVKAEKIRRRAQLEEEGRQRVRQPYDARPPQVVKETIITKEVLIQCRSCGARYPQGTPRCLTCGANL